MSLFRDRADAGRQLAGTLRGALGVTARDQAAAGNGPPPVVVGLPRGGVPVAAEVAAELDAPLDVILVRKLGVPGHEELAFGAVGEDGVRVINSDVASWSHLTDEEMSAVEARERAELERRANRFRAARSREPLAGRVVIVVDDGIATGATARAACATARAEGAARVVLAVPVAPEDWIDRLGDAADDYVSVATPADFGAVGRFYRDFRQVDDAEVVALLAAG